MGSVNLMIGDFIIVDINRKQYVSCLLDLDRHNKLATCKFMRRDFSYNMDAQSLKFKWPFLDDIFEVQDIENSVLGTLLKYTKTRREQLIVNSCITNVFKNLN